MCVRASARARDFERAGVCASRASYFFLKFYLCVFDCAPSSLLCRLSLIAVGWSEEGTLLLLEVQGRLSAGLLLLQRAGSRSPHSAVLKGLSCPAAGGIFLGQRWNSCPCMGRWVLNR